MEYHNDDFDKILEKLNSLYGHVKWKETLARKEYLDIFGERIQVNDVYFKRDICTDFTNALRLSISSMEKFIHCLFQSNGELDAFAEHIIESEKWDAPKATNRVGESAPQKRDKSSKDRLGTLLKECK